MKTVPYPEQASSIKLRHPTYWTPPIDAKLVIYLAGIAGGDILEVGCNEGHTTRLLAEAYPSRKVYAVDWTKNSRLQPPQIPFVPHDEVAVLAKDFPNVVRLDTDSAQLEYPDNIRFIYIDGDHRYEGVAADSERALSYQANHKAMIAWHDYGNECNPDVAKRLNELSDSGMPLVHFEGSEIVAIPYE